MRALPGAFRKALDVQQRTVLSSHCVRGKDATAHTAPAPTADDNEEDSEQQRRSRDRFVRKDKDAQVINVALRRTAAA